MNDPEYVKNLFNGLKNETRLQILQTIMYRYFSLNQLRQKLMRAGYSHSKDRIKHDYLKPLLRLGLIDEINEQYYVTMLGMEVTTILNDFPDFVNVLPAYSECSEEKLLRKLLQGPKTFHEIKELLTPENASRILKRLKNENLIFPPEKKEYISFFRTVRDPKKEILSLFEFNVYNSIPSMGFPVKKIALEAQLSVSRVYKYLRGLKGKKLVFTRKTLRTYDLTSRGKKLALLLKDLTDLIENTWNSSLYIIKN